MKVRIVIRPFLTFLLSFLHYDLWMSEIRLVWMSEIRLVWMSEIRLVWMSEIRLVWMSEVRLVWMSEIRLVWMSEIRLVCKMSDLFLTRQNFRFHNLVDFICRLILLVLWIFWKLMATHPYGIHKNQCSCTLANTWPINSYIFRGAERGICHRMIDLLQPSLL
jgi:hypothetical protein